MKKIINVLLGILLLVFATTQTGWAEEYFPPPRHQQGIIGGYGGQEWRLGQFTGLILNGVTYAWPDADGTATYVLQTDGAGTLSWVSNGAGTAYDDIADPDADSTIVFGDNEINVWTFADTNEDMFNIQGIGAFGDVSVVRIEQKTGAATDGTVLEVVSADANVDPLVVSASAQAGVLVVSQDGSVDIIGDLDMTGALTMVGDLDVTGNLSVSGTWAVDSIAAATAT